MKVKDILPNEKVDEILFFRDLASKSPIQKFKTKEEIPSRLLEKEVLKFWLDEEDDCGLQDTFVIILKEE